MARIAIIDEAPNEPLKVGDKVLLRLNKRRGGSVLHTIIATNDSYGSMVMERQRELNVIFSATMEAQSLALRTPPPRYGWLARLRCFLFGHPFKAAGIVSEQFMRDLGIPFGCKWCGQRFSYTTNLRQYTVKG